MWLVQGHTALWNGARISNLVHSYIYPTNISALQLHVRLTAKHRRGRMNRTDRTMPSGNLQSPRGDRQRQCKQTQLLYKENGVLIWRKKEIYFERKWHFCWGRKEELRKSAPDRGICVGLGLGQERISGTEKNSHLMTLDLTSGCSSTFISCHLLTGLQPKWTSQVGLQAHPALSCLSRLHAHPCPCLERSSRSTYTFTWPAPTLASDLRFISLLHGVSQSAPGQVRSHLKTPWTS